VIWNTKKFLCVLIVTTEWPEYENDITGIHVINQVKQLKEAGVEVSVFNFQGHKNPLNYIKAIRNFRRLNFAMYDVVHAHHGQSGVIALSQRKLPVVVTFHGSDLLGIFDKNGKRTILGRVLQIVSFFVGIFSDDVIIVSEHMSSFFQNRCYHVIPAGFDLDLFSPGDIIASRMKLGLPLDRKLVLFIGDPERTEKRFWLARESVNILSSHQSGVELVLASGVPHENIPLYLNGCDVVLITSVSEGSPTIVKEALACNLPIVSTDVGDVQERIGSVAGCEICEDDSPDTIAAALARVLSQSQRINGRQTVLELDERLLAQNIIQVYRQAMEKLKSK